MITADDVARLEDQERAALETWRTRARAWYRLRHMGAETWGTEAPAPGELMIAQANTRLAGEAWAAADLDLSNARAKLEAAKVAEIVSSAAKYEAIASSTAPSRACRCYSIRNSAGELEGAIAPDCPEHGDNRPNATAEALG